MREKGFAKLGFSDTDWQKVQTLFGLFNAETRLSIAGQTLTPEEVKALESITLKTDEAEGNLFTKATILLETMMAKHNFVRSSVGLSILPDQAFFNDSEKVNLYKQGVTYQQQLDQMGNEQEPSSPTLDALQKQLQDLQNQ
jgi:hypothetical protein